jgi:hypothetical protein
MFKELPVSIEFPAYHKMLLSEVPEERHWTLLDKITISWEAVRPAWSSTRSIPLLPNVPISLKLPISFVSNQHSVVTFAACSRGRCGRDWPLVRWWSRLSFIFLSSWTCSCLWVLFPICGRSSFCPKFVLVVFSEWRDDYEADTAIQVSFEEGLFVEDRPFFQKFPESSTFGDDVFDELHDISISGYLLVNCLISILLGDRSWFDDKARSFSSAGGGLDSFEDVHGSLNIYYWSSI